MKYRILCNWLPFASIVVSFQCGSSSVLPFEDGGSDTQPANSSGSGASTVGGNGASNAGGSSGSASASSSSPDAGPSSGSGSTSSSSSSSGSDSGAGGACGSATPNLNPFGCSFAWGVDSPGSGASSFLQFGTTWIESGIEADGTFTTCSGCNWVKNNIASTKLIPVYYAYIIGFLGHANGFVDGNQCPSSNPNCPNLTNQGATLIRNNRSAIVKAYGDYAQQTHAAWPTKPLVWMLEGDFIQYSGTSQSNPLTLTELGQLAADITCAIKSNMPNAVVAIDHSTWNSDQQTNDFWNAMKAANYDMVWTTGVANNGGYFATGTGPSSYNGKTATYAYIHQITGKTILVDDGCGGNTNEDWKQGPASVLNARIADGVIAFTHCGSLESTYPSAIGSLAPQLSTTCR